MEGKPKYYIMNISGGKDSTALFLEWLKRHKENPEEYPLNEVLNIDLGKEFPVAYEVIDKLTVMAKEEGIKVTILRPNPSWDELMFEAKKKAFKNKKYAHIKVQGRSWPTGKIRWCTGELKKDVSRNYYKNLREIYDVKQIIAIAADEIHRLGTDTAAANGQIHPLADWGWTEKDCLQYCYDHGIDWGGYYEKMDRLSCYCCPMKNYKELHVMRRDYPEVWEKLREMDDKTWHTFKDGCTVRELEIRFDLEDEFIARGESIKSRKFFKELRERVPWFNVDLPCGFKPSYLKAQDEDLYNEFMDELNIVKEERERKAKIAQENRDKRAGIKKDVAEETPKEESV